MNNKWIDEEIKFLTENYPKYGRIYCARKLNKSKTNIGRMINKLKLIRIKSITSYQDIPSFLWQRMRSRAKFRDIKFEVNLEYLWEIFVAQDRRCALSGQIIFFNQNGETTASLDRIDSSKGYEIGNVQWVHKQINRMKSNLIDRDFYDICATVALYRKDFVSKDIEWIVDFANDTEFPIIISSQAPKNVITVNADDLF